MGGRAPLAGGTLAARFPAWVVTLGSLAILASAALAARDLHWEAILAPLREGADSAGGYRLVAVRRGPRNDVIADMRRGSDGARVEVHVAQRGRWSGVIDTPSFGVGYDANHSTGSNPGAVAAAVAETIRARDHGLPTPDAIPLSAGEDPSLLPVWLEALRGWSGVCLGLSLFFVAVSWDGSRYGSWGGSRGGSWQLGLGIGLAVVDLSGAAFGFPRGQPQLHGSWILPLGLAVLAVVAARTTSRSGLLAVGAVTLGAWLTRLALGAWGPLHVNGMAAFWIAGASTDPLAIAAYGPGYRETFGWIAALGGSYADTAVFFANTLFSSLIVGLAYAETRWLGLPVAVALLVALALGLDPVSIRMAATEAYFPSIVCLSLAAALGLLLEGPWAWLAAGLLGAQAARIHPCAWAVVGIVPVVVLAQPGGSALDAGVRCFRAVLAMAGVVVASSGGPLLDVLGNVRSGTLMLSPVPPDFRALGLATLAMSLYARLAPHPRLAGLGLAASYGLFLTRQGYGQSLLWQQCYDRLYLAPLVIVAAALLARFKTRQVVAIAGTVLGVFLAWSAATVFARTTEHLEYRWLARQLRRLPGECRVIYLASVEKRGIVLPAYVRPAGASTIAVHPHLPGSLAEALAPAPCLYYVRSSLCSSAEGRPRCAEFEARLGLGQLAQASFPAHPSSTFLAYDRDPVEIFLARVDRIDGQTVGRQGSGG